MMSTEEQHLQSEEYDHTTKDTSDDEIIFDEDTSAASIRANDKCSDGWKVLIVDDEKDVHTVTRLALEDFSYKNRPICFLQAYNVAEAKQHLSNNEDIGLAFIDVVMDTNDAGLELVRYIREELHNNFIQVVLRTGQPGYAPEKEVISNYYINDYKAKTELTTEKLFALVMSNLRAYDNIISLESYRRDLEKKVKHRTSQLRKQKKALEKVNKTKDKFFSILAHDLRNPFTALLGYAELLRDDFDTLTDNEKLHFLDEIYNTTNQTFALLENLLHWSRSQTGRLKIHKESITLEEVVETTIELLSGIAAKKNIEIKREYSAGAVIWADAFMMTTIIRNLLSNAIKFTPANGAITIGSSMDEENVYLTVSDTGVGISKDDKQKLFRLDESFTKRGTAEEGGTGLGLILCKEFIEKQGGALLVESELGKGSVFTVQLPRKK